MSEWVSHEGKEIIKDKCKEGWSPPAVPPRSQASVRWVPQGGVMEEVGWSWFWVCERFGWMEGEEGRQAETKNEGAKAECV